MLYTGNEERNPQGHDTVVNNDIGPVTCTKGQKIGWIFMVIITLGILLIYRIIKLNDLNRKQIKINESASNIDVQLQNRFDTLSKLVNAVKSHTKFNKEVYETIAAYRSGVNNSTNTQKAEMIDKISRGINVAFENYPELGADESIRKMMNEATMIEKEIAAARRLYNSEVTSFNQQIYTFPINVLVANKGYQGIPLFEANESSRKDVNLEF